MMPEQTWATGTASCWSELLNQLFRLQLRHSALIGMQSDVSFAAVFFSMSNHDVRPAHQLAVAGKNNHTIIVVSANRGRRRNGSLLQIDAKILGCSVIFASCND